MPSRIPPHYLPAEEALLGAMLLSRQAIEDGLAGCSAADFYKPAHLRIFDTMGRLWARGGAVDPTTVAAEMGTDRRELLRLQASTPASANAVHYARTVNALATLRNLIDAGGEIAEMGWDGEESSLQSTLDAALKRVGSAQDHHRVAAAVESHELANLLAQPPPTPRPWVIPGLLTLGESMVLSGGEGAGKMTLLRQFGLGVAAGVHPFTDQPMTRRRVVVVDLQEELTEMRAEFGWMHRHVASHYHGGLHLVSRRGGINLLGADARWFESLLAQHEPELVLMGPLKWCYRPPEGRGLWDDDVVDTLHQRFNEWQHRYGFTLCLEGHAGHDRETWRIKGSSAWYGWPHFGKGLDPQQWKPQRVVRMVQWRGDRENGVRRHWPIRLTESGGWPWAADADAVEAMRAAQAAGDPAASEQPALDSRDVF